MFTRTFKVYGQSGHRQRLSFFDSASYDFSRLNPVTGSVSPRIISVDCADKTGTNDYVLVTITRETAEDCLRELAGQLVDGIFENSRIGTVAEVISGEDHIIDVFWQ